MTTFQPGHAVKNIPSSAAMAAMIGYARGMGVPVGAGTTSKLYGQRDCLFFNEDNVLECVEYRELAKYKVKWLTHETFYEYCKNWKHTIIVRSEVTAFVVNGGEGTVWARTESHPDTNIVIPFGVIKELYYDVQKCLKATRKT